ncbi:hypothetical protein BU24DRAFT_238667 [Aaosphaeria arxii CBS 175.79]|uniref:T6SS Phospholipase effector Tle1-like catalytic domain-containing protein n=1 Tax=Aaosphaeria arxii CBS 175.79 TaxID=1450172 RepID=A0A6A5XKS5_9PLEO|nr:uncharacterized protein BU24DRAFT_238667 [Aaosphaeria arxii CBS 175.79]KAF2013461.1 hypothetical protein BU24DRAFT_238667 [Aaosphaeria arxii CBS 175.79]
MGSNQDLPWSRRIIICCDGTWQSSVDIKENVPSNVTKLCRHIARIGHDKNNPSKKFHQLVYYDSGVGTGNISSSEKRRQGGLGAGLAENVIEAYNFIVLNYEPGDEIFCFGFSRGAYTARAVAGLVTDIGVIKPLDMQVFPAIYRAYKRNEEGKEFRDTDEWKEFINGKLSQRGHDLSASQRNNGAINRAQSWEIPPHGDLSGSEQSRKVKVVGVWDTVGSLGIPDVAIFDNSNLRTKHGFHNVKLNGSIEHAFHALALDEKRKAFRPTLWYIPNELIKEGKPLPELKQVWFPGVHINSGGGSDDCITEMKGDLEHLAMTSFCWMLQCISPYLTIDQTAFHSSMEQYQRWLDTVRYNCTYHHETMFDWVKKKIPNIPIINPADDELAPPKRDPAHVHSNFDYGWGTGPIVDSYSGMYRLAGVYPRVPGHCQAEIYEDAGKEYKLQDVAKYGQTNEYIHPVCHYRDVVRGPELQSALKDWTRNFEPEEHGKGRFWWRIKDEKKALPEWVILKHENDEVNFERAWYNHCEKTDQSLAKLKKSGYVKDFLATLDERVDFTVKDRDADVYP